MIGHIPAFLAEVDTNGVVHVVVSGNLNHTTTVKTGLDGGKGTERHGLESVDVVHNISLAIKKVKVKAFKHIS